jgi:hypothetical protein
MRRLGAGLVCGLLVLAACDSPDHMSGSTPSASQRAQPVGSLCDRVRPSLAGTWTSAPAEPSRNLIPVSDNCWLTDAADAKNQIRISVSVLPISADDAAAIRQSEDFYPTDVASVDGGIGTGSWAVDSAYGATLVFSSGEHQVRLKRWTPRKGQLDEFRGIARTINELPGVLPDRPALQSRPECDAGTPAAEKLLGASAVVRRDTMANGLVRCVWGSARATAFAEAGRGPGSKVGKEFTEVKTDAPTQVAPKIVRVKVGAEGWEHANGISYRIGKGTYVTVGAVPLYSAQPTILLTLARAMLPTYSG